MHDVSGYTFYRDVFGGWRWECYDSAGEALDSREAFDTSNECIDDARHDKHRRGGLTTQLHGERMARAVLIGNSQSGTALLPHCERDAATV